MNKKAFGIIFLLFILLIDGSIFSQTEQVVKDIYETIPDNEYYVTIFFTSGGSRIETVSSCAEALNMKDRALRQDNVESITIRAKYRVHLWHDDCNKRYHK